MRRYAFLQCIRCIHFRPKRLFPQFSSAGSAIASAAYVGLCAAGDRPEWVVWQSLEWAASQEGSCPDRQPFPALQADCPLCDFTNSSAALPYPKACIYHGTPACPKS